MVNHPNRTTIENTLFPGRPNYTGPAKGWFGFLHHERVCEESHDVNERIDYVKREKPKNEVPIRLHNMIYLGECAAIAKRDALDAGYKAKRDALDAGYEADYEVKSAPLYAGYNAKRAPLYAGYKAKRAALYAGYNAKRDALYAGYKAKRAPLDAGYEAKRAALDAKILAYIKLHIPDCAWNGKTLVFTSG